MGVPTAGHEMDGADGTSQAGSAGLLSLAALSLEDLSQLDESVVAGVISDLVRRHRCGTDEVARFDNWQAAL